MSTDAAHSLGDALGVDLGGAAQRARPVEVEPGLSALQISPPHLLGESWRVVQDYLLVGARHPRHRPGGGRGADPAARGRGGRGAARAARRRSSPGRGTSSSSTAPPPPRRCGCWPCPRRSPGTSSACCPAQRGLIRTLRPAAAAAAGVPAARARGRRGGDRVAPPDARGAPHPHRRPDLGAAGPHARAGRHRRVPAHLDVAVAVRLRRRRRRGQPGLPRRRGRRRPQRPTPWRSSWNAAQQDRAWSRSASRSPGCRSS